LLEGITFIHSDFEFCITDLPWLHWESAQVCTFLPSRLFPAFAMVSCQHCN